MKKWLPLIVTGAFVAGVAGASTIPTFSSGDAITAANLNAAFSHIHGSMVGGHGARLVNADVSGTAAISQTKIANANLFPRAWAIWKTACLTGTTPCSPSVGVGVTDVVWNATGDYSVRLTTGRADTLYSVFVTAYSASGADTVCGVYGLSTGTTLGSFGVKCYTAGVAADAAFQVVVLDNA